MKKELKEKLMQDFPDLFALAKKPTKAGEPFWPIALGIDCGDGWEPILRRLCEKLTGKGVTVHQIKEKFGGLRFYVGSESENREWLNDAVDEAEAESLATCEDCGTTGSDVSCAGEGWIRTLCRLCRIEWEKRRAGR